MRAKIASAILLLALVASAATPGGAALPESPCDADASLCAATAPDASCVATGAYVATPAQPIARSETSITKPEEFEHDAVHQAEFGFRTPPLPSPLPPTPAGDASVHIGSVESWCTSFLFDGATKSKSCGSGELGEVIVDLNRGPDLHVRVRAEAITTTTCVSAEPLPLAPLINTHYENLVVEIGSGNITLPANPAPNSVFPPGAVDNFVAVNEQFVDTVPGCAAAASTALRIKSGSTTIMVGWASAVACKV